LILVVSLSTLKERLVGCCLRQFLKAVDGITNF
jgi:hypothetical protein